MADLILLAIYRKADGMVEFKKTNKKQGVVVDILILTFTLFLSYYLFFNDEFLRHISSTQTNNKQTQETHLIIGRIKTVKNDVKSQELGSYSWVNLNKNESLHNEQKIFTGAHSQSELELEDNSSFVLNENTIIQLEQANKKTVLNFIQGSFIGTFKKGATVVLNGKHLTIQEDSKIFLKQEPNQEVIKIQIEKGALVSEEDHSTLSQQEIPFEISPPQSPPVKNEPTKLVNIHPTQSLVVTKASTEKKTTRSLATTTEKPSLKVASNEDQKLDKKDSPGLEKPVLPLTPSEDKTKSKLQSLLNFSVETGYSRIYSTYNSANLSATLLSRPILGANFSWQQDLSENWQGYFRLGFELIPYEDTSQGVLLNRSQNLSILGAGLNRKFGESIFTTFEIGGRSEIFAPAYQPGVATLEVKNIPYARFLVSEVLLEIKNLTFTTTLGGSYLSSLAGTNYNIYPGQEYLFRLQLSEKMEGFSLSTSAEFFSLFQNTSFTTETSQELRFHFGFSFPLNRK